MKNKLGYICFVAFFMVLLSSCKKEDNENTTDPVTVSDPAGTITVSVSPDGYVVYEEVAADAPWVPGYTFEKIRLYMFLSTSNLNASFRTDAGFIDGTYWGTGIGFQSGQIASYGKIDGLGNITTKPSSGYSSVGILEKGYGYVLRSKKYFVDTPEAPYAYYRLFVVDWIVNVSDGINAAKIKIQGPY